jgi:hypothetical protein
VILHPVSSNEHEHVETPLVKSSEPPSDEQFYLGWGEGR